MGKHSPSFSRRRYRFGAGGVLFLLAVLGSGPLVAAPAKKDDLKAGALSKIIHYLSWPRVDAPIVVGLYGSDPFGGRLQELVEGLVEGRAIQVHVIKSEADFPRCQVLFVPEAMSPRWSRWRQGNPPIPGQLTVGEEEDFATKRGGICSLLIPGEKLQIQINRENARSANLKISSKLLKLAELVK
jgi:hypothetical protein